MKGIVFTEFLEMVEQHHSADMVDELIEHCALPSGGIYTAVGTYDHREIVQLVMALAERTDTPVPALLQAFGNHLFGRFVQLYPQFFSGVASAFELLHGIDSIIHKEVHKLYPDAELPKFDTRYQGDHQLVMIYRSPRHMEDLAEGLIRACIAHYDTPIQLAREPIRDSSGPAIQFTLTHSA